MLQSRQLVLKFVAAFVLIACALLYGSTHFYRDPGSAFFDVRRAYEERYSLTRKAEVLRFMESNRGKTEQDVINKAGSNATLCVSLGSVKRPAGTVYLETTIASILEGLTDHERADLNLAVLIAETDPERHPSWSNPAKPSWPRTVVDDMYTYTVQPAELEHLRDLTETSNFREKGVYDYIYAMQHCYETGTPYIAFFEDDVMLAEGWLVRTLLGIRDLEQMSPEPDSWLFMRLFNQERSIGWASHEIGGNNELWIVTGVGLLMCAIAWLIRRKWPAMRAHLDVPTMCLICLLVNPAIVVLFFQSGKASLLPHSPGVFDEPFGCCSQALVFPRAQAKAVIDFLRLRKDGQVDLFLDDLAREAGLKRFALYPVMAQHIGLSSARNTQESEAQAIWSVAYEDLDHTAVAEEHVRMVEEYYGVP